MSGEELATDAILSEEPEAHILDSDENLEPEILIPEYAETSEENIDERQGENKDEETEEPQKDLTVPPAEPKDVIEQQKQETPKKKKEEEEEMPSDFLLPKQTDDFLQPDVDPDIPSQVSQLTVTTEYGGADQKSEAAAPTAAQDKERKNTLIKDVEFKKISGDFAVGTFVKLPSRTSIETYKSEIDEGEAEESRPEVAELEVFDRELYYQMHATLTSELPAVKIRNNFLQKKMVEYFRKRNMEHVFKETDQQIDTQQKYWKRLDAFHDLLDLDQRRRLVINAELNDLKKERDDKFQFVRKAMKGLIEREKDVSDGLIHTKTGKEIPDKVLERLLKRQWYAVEQVAQYRLKYTKIRNRVTEKREALQTADALGANLRLVDYEQLRVENRGFADKVEERDEELTKLRIKCDGIFQVLAHLREKSASATVDIISEQAALQAIEIEYMEARERKNYFKVERDHYRNLVNKLKEESGILLKPRLLKDMEYAVNEVETTANTLQKVREKQKTQLSKLRAIRKNMELAMNYRSGQEVEKLTPALSRASGFQKEKSSLLKNRR